MKKNREKAVSPAKGPARVYLGFWTSPRLKDSIRQLARRNRQSMSAYIDAVMDDHVARRRCVLP